jgi:presenilin-like A22 family membrane protease
MRLVYTLLLFFTLAQFLGIFTGKIILGDIETNPYVSGLLVTSDTEDPGNALLFTAYVLLGAVISILIIRKLELHFFLFRIIEFILIAMTSSLVFYAFLRLAFGYDISTLGGVLIGLAFASAKIFVHQLKNMAAIFATAGVGVVFGISMGIVPIVFFLILLSIYDFVSVFITKHMVELADFIISKDLAFTITAQRVLPSKEVRRIDLGTGDIIAPIMMEVSLLSYAPITAMFVMIGSVISLGTFLILIHNNKICLPALPPIVLGTILGLLVGVLTGFN